MKNLDTDLHEKYTSTTESLREICDAEIVVAWSGGLDSTLLLDYFLNTKEYSETIIAAVSATPTFIPTNKAMNEERARKSYIDNKIIGTHIKNFTHINLDLSGLPNVNALNTGGVQLAYWITQIYPLMKNNSVLMISTVKGDDQIPFINDCHELFKSLNKFYGKEVRLCFPLVSATKSDIIRLAANRDILNYTWSCEGGDYTNDLADIVTKQCGTCHSCYTHINGLLLAALRPDVNNRIIDHARDEFNLDLGVRIENLGKHPSNRDRDMRAMMEYNIAQSKPDIRPLIKFDLSGKVEHAPQDLSEEVDLTKV